MNITNSLLYLLLLYAVLDKDKRLSLTSGLVIAFVILLLNCYCNSLRGTSSTSQQNANTLFNTLNSTLG